jgi:hypothetical protein
MMAEILSLPRFQLGLVSGLIGWCPGIFNPIEVLRSCVSEQCHGLRGSCLTKSRVDSFSGLTVLPLFVVSRQDQFRAMPVLSQRSSAILGLKKVAPFFPTPPSSP